MHGKRFRRILVENAKGPFAIYQAMLQYGSGMSEMEISDSENIAVYGVKNERPAVAIWIKNSRNVLITGVGGPVKLSKTRGKIVVENSSKVTLTSLTPDLINGGRSLVTSPFVVLKKGEEELPTEACDRPILYKVEEMKIK
jgi:hypothetical protein